MEAIMEVEAKPAIELDEMQSRRFFLAGTVAFPTPFLSVANISVESGTLSGIRSAGGSVSELFVAVYENQELQDETTRLILLTDVSAIFFPGSRENNNEQGKFLFSNADKVDDLEAGEWFFGSDVDVDTINKSLQIDIMKREAGARGIVFVRRDEPVLTICEQTRTAGAADSTPTIPMCDPTCP